MALLGYSAIATTEDAPDHSAHAHHNMSVDREGALMGNNLATLPRDCTEISAEHKFTIHAGREYATDVPGMVFGMSQHEVNVEPCSRVEITFVNDDSVRHQWMVHGLPKYLYPAGMFHIEASGGQTRTGTFIVPGEDRTYLIHCDMAQHMEKGMKGQLVVGRGNGDLWSVAGVSDSFNRSSYLPAPSALLVVLIALAGFVCTIFLRRE